MSRWGSGIHRWDSSVCLGGAVGWQCVSRWGSGIHRWDGSVCLGGAVEYIGGTAVCV